MKTINFLASLVTLAGFVSPAYAQDPVDEGAKKHDIHPHLVGHEDEELLRRIEGALEEWDPRNLTSPYLKQIGTGEPAQNGASPVARRPKYALRRPDLSEFIADPDAAVALGKALFWDMQAGSDFKSKTDVMPATGTACASCHYRFGADARDKNTYSLAYQTWRQFTVDRTPEGQVVPPAEPSRPDQRPGYNPSFTQRFFDFTPGAELRYSWFADPTSIRPGLLQHEIVGSQGIVLTKFKGVNGPKDGQASPETPETIPFPTGTNAFQRRVDMFREGDIRTRQVTQRNSPSVINAVFNDRQFHDGRAESTFNGFSVFGDYDTDAVLKKAHLGEDGKWIALPVRVAIPNASLASQAVGPIVNEVEMSYFGRTFHDIALKLLDAKPLAAQVYSDTDSELGYMSQSGINSYSELIKKAFREEWWRENVAVSDFPLFDRLPKGVRGKPTDFATDQKDHLMINNFSLYWGLSIMLYQSTLVSNDSAFDKMMRGDAKGVEAKWKEVGGTEFTSPIRNEGNQAMPPEPPLDGSGYGGTAGKRPDDIIRKVQLDRLPQLAHPPTLSPTAMFQRGFRVFVRNCAECHEPPTFTTAGEIDLGPEIPEPIAKLHAHALVRTALADAFKDRLIANGFPPPAGVNDTNRNSLGGRRFFLDDDRLAELEALGGPLMIENMGVPSTRPDSFFGGNGDRVPMITWLGTRPPLGFSPTPGKRAIDPYAFYDLSFYNIGVSEPRYDWGVWAFDGADEILTSEIAIELGAKQFSIPPDVIEGLRNMPTGEKSFEFSDIKEQSSRQKTQQRMSQDGVTEEGFTTTINQLDIVMSTPQARKNIAETDGLPSLGSAYRLPKRRRAEAPLEAIPTDSAIELMKMFQWNSEKTPVRPADHSAERNYLDYTPERPGGTANRRADYHFFKRSRRMVMTEEPWGHRKHFISDNELMGWGAFKTPSLRNVALTEPYMHNGRFLTLRQVLTFYSFDNPDLIPAHRRLNPDLHPEMGRLDLNSDGLLTGADGKPGGLLNLPQVNDAEALLFFLHCLTDDRVVMEKAPFDHPSINLVNGYEGNPDNELVIKIKAVGKQGQLGKAPPQFPSSAGF